MKLQNQILKETKALSILRNVHLTEDGVVGHFQHLGSCEYNLFVRLMNFIKKSNDVYFPVHFIILLMKLKKSKRGERLAILKKSLFGYCRSTLYAAVFACSFPIMTCYPKKLGLPLSGNLCFFGVSFPMSWAIFIEHKKRWSEISLWVFAKWIESIVISLKKRRVWINVPYGINFSFAIAVALITSTYFNSSGLRTGKYDKIFNLLVGKVDSKVGKRVEERSDKAKLKLRV